MLDNGVDDSATELDDAQIFRHQRGIGIESHAERRTVALDGVGEPIPEMTRRAHAYQDTSRPRRAVPEPIKRGRPEAAS
jgi:hypothetical protein